MSFFLDKALRKADSAEARINELELRIEKLSLLSQALWELARDRLHLTDEQLFDLVEQIDLLDGSKDGKIGQKAKVCQNCGRKNTDNKNRVYVLRGAD